MCNKTVNKLANCKICNSPTCYLYENDSFVILHCPVCDFKFKIYPVDYDFNAIQYEDGQWIAGRDTSRRQREEDRRKRFNNLKRYLISGNFLDIGPGPGWDLKQARDSGYEPIGIETSSKNVEYIKETYGIDCHNCLLADAGLSKNSIQNILVSHVIEHIPDPGAFMKEVVELLQPGGRVLIFTPNAASYSERLFKDNNSFYNTLDHISFFSPKSLRYLADLAGLRCITIQTREAHCDFCNKLVTYAKIRITGQRCRELNVKNNGSSSEGPSLENKISKGKRAARIFHSSSKFWGQAFKLSELFGKGSELFAVLAKR